MKREALAGVAGGALAGAAQSEPMIEIPQRLLLRLVDQAIVERFDTRAIMGLEQFNRPQAEGVNRIRPRVGDYRHDGIYAGVTLHEQEACELILLPETFKGKWEDAMKWAEEQKGALPSRIDQLVLFKNLKSEFEDAYYWSGEQHAGGSGSAWTQGFSYGTQAGNYVCYASRARAVRRIPIR